MRSGWPASVKSTPDPAMANPAARDPDLHAPFVPDRQTRFPGREDEPREQEQDRHEVEQPLEDHSGNVAVALIPSRRASK
jgi:hypothetical protein